MAKWQDMDCTVLHTSVSGDIGFSEDLKGQQVTCLFGDGSKRAVMRTAVTDPDVVVFPRPVPTSPEK